MRYIFMIIGTFLGVLFLIQMRRGKEYEYLVQDLDTNAFPAASMYVVGFAWSATKLFALKGALATKQKSYAGMLYDPQYADYYANVVWAQTLTFTHLCLALIFLLAGLLYAMAVLLVGGGLVLTAILVLYFLENTKNELSKRTDACNNELPEVVSTMAILVSSGMTLRDAWNTIANGSEGEFYEQMRKASNNMLNGYTDADAIFLFGKASNSVEIKKFISALLQSMERGGGELGIFLTQQSSELWNTKRQRMLQTGEKAATKLLLPIMLIFVGIIAIVITAAFAGGMF